MKKKAILLFMTGAILSTNISLNIQMPGFAKRARTWAKQKKEKTKRMWFCLRHRKECSETELKESRKWIAGASGAAIAAALAAVGIAISANVVDKMKETTLWETKQVHQAITNAIQIIMNNTSAIGKRQCIAMQAVHEEFQKANISIERGAVLLRKQEDKGPYLLYSVWRKQCP